MISKIKTTYILIFFAALYLVHYYFIASRAVNVPAFDEWEFFTALHPFPKPPLSWFFAFHNEHIIVPTKLLALASYDLWHFNFAYQQIFNFFLFGILVATNLLLFYRIDKERFLYVLPFCVFYLSDRVKENHSWGFQSQFHFFILFALGFLVSIREKLSWTRTLGLMALLALMSFSFSAGLICSLLLATSFALYSTLFAKVSRPQALVLLVWAALLAFLWSRNYPPADVPKFFPWSKSFWSYFSGFCASYLGPARTNDLYGTFAMLLIFYTAYRSLWLVAKTRRLEFRQWQLLTLFFVIVAIISAITVGRAAFGHAQSKGSRYFEIAMILLPTIALIWMRLEKKKFLVFLWLVALIGYCNAWNFGETYTKIQGGRLQALDCIRHHPEQICPTAYPGLITDRIRYARELGASFMKEEQ